jgi:DNA-binding response OmpR family regulator
MTMPRETIFIVDDEPANLALLYNSLETGGFKVFVKTNAESALEVIGQIQPDLILLDVMLPDIDGFETCRRLKADESTKDIPVIFMTALSESVDEVKGLELGAVDYITKPFQVETVLARVKTHLTLRNMQKTLEEKNAQLQKALATIKTLKGWITICANCKRVQVNPECWDQIETYIENHSEALFTHGLCPECAEKMYGEKEWYKKMHGKK